MNDVLDFSQVDFLEYLKTLRKSVISFDINKLRVNDDVFLEYDGDIAFLSSTIEIPKIMRHFQKVNGNIYFDSCGIIDFENLENLEYINGNLIISRSKIESFKGLGKIEHISRIGMFDCCPNFKIFDGLNPFVNVEGTVDGYKIYPEERNQEFLEWQEQARKSKQIKDISKKLLECI